MVTASRNGCAPHVSILLGCDMNKQLPKIRRQGSTEKVFELRVKGASMEMKSIIATLFCFAALSIGAAPAGECTTENVTRDCFAKVAMQQIASLHDIANEGLEGKTNGSPISLSGIKAFLDKKKTSDQEIETLYNALKIKEPSQKDGIRKFFIAWKIMSVEAFPQPGESQSKYGDRMFILRAKLSHEATELTTD